MMERIEMKSDILAYVLALDLPEKEPQYERTTPVVEFSDQREAVTVGAQLAEFSENVTPGQRAAVSDCLLLAQLAANKATAMGLDLMAWYRKYIEVLQNIGWTTTSMSFEERRVDDTDADVHQVIIPVLTSMLGPIASAASIVVSVLEGLQQMDKANPWITLFDRASQHASGAKFQLGFVDASAGGDATVQIKLLALAIDAKRSVTQVLFFKFSGQEAKLASADGQFDIGAARLDSIKDAVTQRVAPFLNDNISKIDL